MILWYQHHYLPSVKFGQLHSVTKTGFEPLKYLRRTAGYTFLNHRRNEEILEELLVTPLEDKL
jgi:hypothetical protein